MMGILIITHENFGEAMIKSSELIVGQCEGVEALGLFRGDDIGAFACEVKNKILEMNSEEGVLIFTDLFGASPYNAVALATKELDVECKCIAGFNFAMLLEAIVSRHCKSIDDLSISCMNLGKENIKELFEELSEINGGK